MGPKRDRESARDQTQENSLVKTKQTKTGIWQERRGPVKKKRQKKQTNDGKEVVETRRGPAFIRYAKIFLFLG